MMPGYVVTDPGNATAGNAVSGPFTGPLTIQEVQVTFLTVDEDVEVEDVVCSTAAGASPAQGHQLRVGVGDSQRIAGVYNAAQLLPSNQSRRPLRLRFFKGETLYFTSVQKSGAIEAVEWAITLKKPGAAPRRQ